MSLLKNLVGWTAVAAVVLFAIVAYVFRPLGIVSTLAWVAAGGAALVGAINTVSYGWGKNG